MGNKKLARKGIAKKTKQKAANISKKINNEVIAEALSCTTQPVFLKLCRLCESKDGPFLNIFDPDMITAKKIEAVMPFVIAENDDLPHKICFRCSAKVEELYEFIQKCTQSQHHLRKTLCSKVPIVSKPKHRDIWEEKLNQSNISNDDICDALIKKAMEGIKDIPVQLFKQMDEVTPNRTDKTEFAKDSGDADDFHSENSDFDDISLKNMKLNRNTIDEVQENKTVHSNIEKLKNIDQKAVKEIEAEAPLTNKKNETTKSATIDENLADKPVEKPTLTTNTFSLSETSENTFNIMDHVSMIKVNGVGVLFQCKLCNRNFLKREVVLSHACAKNGAAKILRKTPTLPEPLKVSSVKYINTRVISDSLKPINDHPISIDDDDDDKPLFTKKTRPKIGPASRVKRDNVDQDNLALSCTQIHVNPTPNSNMQVPTVQFPSLPSLNSRYKLMPGPNNTFTLVEEKGNDGPISTGKLEISVPPLEPIKRCPSIAPKRVVNAAREKDEAVPPLAMNEPYPVGLFKTLPTSSNINSNVNPPPLTPTMKKQSYTVVQTGNPSKLLISSKPQPAQEVPMKRQRKTRQVRDEPVEEPFSVTIEDEAPPRDTEFFTFINVDPLLQPSYVLPTNNIIQESQISTSTSILNKETDKDLKYTCNMCNEKFNREKKLLSHIQSHYNKMDEEDQKRIHHSKKGKK